MYKTVLLDATPLALLVHPRVNKAKECNRWVKSLIISGIKVCLPEIADYEVRRGLIKMNAVDSIKKLDMLNDTLEYLPLSTTIMRKASEFWAQARKMNRQTDDDKALDVDMILSAQATLATNEKDAVIATENVGHLSLFSNAKKWKEIVP